MRLLEDDEADEFDEHWAQMGRWRDAKRQHERTEGRETTIFKRVSSKTIGQQSHCFLVLIGQKRPADLSSWYPDGHLQGSNVWACVRSEISSFITCRIYLRPHLNSRIRYAALIRGHGFTQNSWVKEQPCLLHIVKRLFMVADCWKTSPQQYIRNTVCGNMLHMYLNLFL